MIEALNSLVPIVLLVVLGAALFRGRFMSSELRSGMDQFTYWVALPSLFIHDLADTDFAQLEAFNLLVVLVLATVSTALLAAVMATVFAMKDEHSGVFVQLGFRGNLAFVGLPLIIFASDGAAGADVLVASALVALAVLVPINNVIAVMALLLARHEIDARVWKRLAVKVVTNPLIISAFLGIAIGALGWRLPVMVDRPFELLGQTAIALALVSLGGSLMEMDTEGNRVRSLASGASKWSRCPSWPTRWPWPSDCRRRRPSWSWSLPPVRRPPSRL